MSCIKSSVNKPQKLRTASKFHLKKFYFYLEIEKSNYLMK